MAPTRDFHTQLLLARKRRHLTQQDLADKIGKREKDIGRWETGANMPQISSVSELAEALDAPELLEIALAQARADAQAKRARRGKQR